MCNFYFSSKRVVAGFSICLVLFPSLLVSSLWMTRKQRTSHEEWSKIVATKPDEYYYRDPRHQVVYLDHIANKFRQDSNGRSRQLNVKSRRYGSSFSNLQVIQDTSASNDYSWDDSYNNDLDPYDYDEKPNCHEGKKKRKKTRKYLSMKKKASIILGLVGLAFGKLGLISFSSLVVSDDTTTTSTISSTTPTTTTDTTSTTSTTSTTTPTTTTDTTTTPTTTTVTTTTPTTTTETTTTPTTTTDTTTTTSATTTTTTTMMPMTCGTVDNNPTGTYKTIRTPGIQVEQCLSVTAAAGSEIQITCTSINVSTGNYVTLLDLAGTNIVANPPVVNTTYTTADNTLIIKSLASSANADQLCCTWITV